MHVVAGGKPMICLRDALFRTIKACTCLGRAKPFALAEFPIAISGITENREIGGLLINKATLRAVVAHHLPIFRDMLKLPDGDVTAVMQKILRDPSCLTEDENHAYGIALGYGKDNTAAFVDRQKQYYALLHAGANQQELSARHEALFRVSDFERRVTVVTLAEPPSPDDTPDAFYPKPLLPQ